MRRRITQRPAPRRWPRASPLGGVWLVALVGTLLLMGCGTARSVPTVRGTPTPPPTATPAPTPTVAPARPLEWVRRTAPPGVWLEWGGSSGTRGMLATAPSDGATAYVCFVPGNVYESSATVQMWVTHDAAATWQALPPVTPPTPVQNCRLRVDSAAAGTLVVELAHSYGMGGGPNGEIYHYFSQDSGATWQAYLSKYSLVSHLVTVNGRIYATLRRPPYSRSSSYGALVVSTDGLRTRTQLYPFGPPASDRDAQDIELAVWGNPYTGELLVQQYGGGVANQWQLGISRDGGATWRKVQVPVRDYTLLVRQPDANQPWTLCISRYAATPAEFPALGIFCSGDSGATWQERGNLLGGGAYVMADGSLLGWTGETFRRWTPSATQWEALGGWPAGYDRQLHYGGPILAGHMLWLPDDRQVPPQPQPPVPAAIYVARVP